MKKDYNSPQYEDVAIFTCLLYPLVATSIELITLGGSAGAGLIPGVLSLCIVVYLPVASLVFACVKKKSKRARACILSTFVGLIAVFFVLLIIAYGLMGPSIGILGAVLGLLILLGPYMLCCAIYLILLKRAAKKILNFKDKFNRTQREP